MKSTSNEKEKKRIKSFIYLDEYKMYSISSQIFEGLTESITSYSRNIGEDREHQEGPVGSGRVLADIIRKESSIEERKFLHDYSYSLFEAKISEEDRILHIDSENIHDAIGCIEEYDFVAVRGKVLFNDINLVNETLENISSLVEAAARISIQSDEVLLQKYKNESVKYSSTKKANKSGFSTEKSEFAKNKRETMSDKSSMLREIKKNIGGEFFDEELLESLSTVLNYGYEDQFETRTYLTSEDDNKYLFSTMLKRIHLREAEALIVRKYSRFSEKDFVVVGMVTQNQNERSSLSDVKSPAPNEMRELVMQLTLGFSEMERKFTGKLKNEIMIDPIAIYREL